MLSECVELTYQQGRLFCYSECGCLCLLDTLKSTVFAHTKKFDWICREAAAFTLDSDGIFIF